MIKILHSYWAYFVIISIALAIFNSTRGLLSKRKFKDIDLRLALFPVIAINIQLIIGLITFYISNSFETLRDTGFSESMSNASLRKLIIEHPMMSIASVVFIIVGFLKHNKKTTDKSKFKTILVFYSVAIILLFSRFPWSQWFSS